MGCGNIGGTGNHCEIWTGVLIKTELNEDEIKTFYQKNDADYFYDAQVIKVDDKNTDSLFLGGISEKFSGIKNISENSGYFVVNFVETPVSSLFDVRGS